MESSVLGDLGGPVGECRGLEFSALTAARCADPACILRLPCIRTMQLGSACRSVRVSRIPRCVARPRRLT